VSILETYTSLHAKYLQHMEGPLRELVIEAIEGAERVDSVACRAKSPDRFFAKAQKTNEDGSNKYLDPLVEIQDQIGARITVFYLKDVDTISERILKYFVPIEIQNKQPANDYEFGYFGEHFVLKIPDDILPDGVDDPIPEFFELQIKTLFQHAWSEAHHDLGYKSIRALTALENRKVAFTAAQAWGADRIFQELADELVYQTSQDLG